MVRARAAWRRRWRGDGWNGVVSCAIDLRLGRKRERLAALLDIDLADSEWRQQLQPLPPRPPGTTSRSDSRGEVTRYIAWRKLPPAGGSSVHLIDLALEDLSVALRRCWNLAVEVDRKPSIAGVRHRLQSIRSRPKRFAGSIDEIDPETQGALEDAALAAGLGEDLSTLTPTQLRTTAQAALELIPAPGPGRPSGHLVAKQQLAADLAAIYEQYSGRRPTRIYQEATGLEGGRFKEFVSEIWSIVPVQLRQTQKAGEKTADHLVRLAVDHVAQMERQAKRRKR